MLLSASMRVTYNKYLLTVFGPLVTWRRRFALWPRRSTYTGNLLWLKFVMAGYHYTKADFGRVVLEQRVLTLADQELTHLSLLGFKIE